MSPDFLKIWLEGGDEPCFNFNGARVPYLEDGHPAMNDLVGVFPDTFLFHVLFDDDYGKNTVTMPENNTPEDPYGYTDWDFDVCVKSGGHCD